MCEKETRKTNEKQCWFVDDNRAKKKKKERRKNKKKG